MPKHPIKSRCWCYTSFLTTVDDPDGALYHVYGREVCPDSGRKHLQGYIRFKFGKTMRAVKALLGDPAVHLEKRKGTERVASDYCKKDGDFVERGECADAAPGKRTDLEVVRGLLGQGNGMAALLDAGVGYQGCRYAELYLKYKEPEKNPDDGAPNVRWYWGDTGTGKSRASHAEANEADVAVHRCSGPAGKGGKWWFDGYDAHTHVIIDDFRPSWCGLSFLLSILDRYGRRVEHKGGSRQWKATDIWITSPKHPESYFQDSGEDLEQLLRRLTTIKEFTL